ncbi:MAG: glycerophosphodiester phosphodiesterase family protein [Planctomycetota bacterium]|nr:glycerophosphodiester phosphodiesterase family protein [Planctomycetota bacterium]
MRFVTRFLTFTLLLGSLSAQEKLQSSEGLETKNQTKVVAHRGLILDAPENTIASFRACLELGFGFEFDVQRTRDGHLVCLHDVTVDRTTDGKGAIAQLNRYQTVGFDAGSWFSPRFKGQVIPGIDDVFRLIASYPQCKAIFAVDIKLDDKKVETDLVKLANQYKILHRLLFIGNTIHDPEVRKRLRAADATVNLTHVAHDSKELLESVANPDTNWVYVRYLPSAAEIKKIHAAGKRVFIAGKTVSGLEKAHWQMCIDMGVDAILTDYSIELARQLRN